MKRIFFVLFLFFGCAGLHAHDTGWKDYGLMLKGGKQYRKQKYGLALETYKKALEKTPGSQTIVFNTANALYQLKDYSSAIETYDRAVETDGDYTQSSYFNKGNAFYKTGETKKAKEAYRKAILLNPKDKQAIHNLQLLLQESKEDDKDEKKKDDPENKEQDPRAQDPNSGTDREQASDISPEQKQQQIETIMQMAREQEQKSRARANQKHGSAPASNPEKDW